MKLDKQSVADVAWSVLGGVIGGVATGAFLASRWLKQDYQKPQDGKQ
jgi:hypothetical protein